MQGAARETGFRFSNRLNTGALYLGFGGAEGGLQQRLLFTVAYLAPDGETPSPNTIDGVGSFTLAQAWRRDDGLLLVLGEPVDHPASFEAKVRRLDLPPSTRLLWIANPTDTAADWAFAAFPLTSPVERRRELLEPVRLCFTTDKRGYVLEFEAGTRFGVDEESIIRVDAKGAKASARFGRDDCMLELRSGALDIEMAAAPGATFAFGFDVPGGEALVDWFDALDVGLRYSYATRDGGIDSIRFPIFAKNRLLPALEVSARVMGSRLTDRTFSGFETRFSKPTRFTSWFRTVDGRTCQLATCQLALSFAWAPTRLRLARPDRLTVVPQATFELSVGKQVGSVAEEPDPGDHQLLCGTSGSEYVRLPKDVTSYQLRLEPGWPAFAAGFGAAGEGGGGVALTSETTTAWVRFSADEPLECYAQPEGQAAMFDATNAAGSEAVPLLPYFPMIATHLQPGDGAPFLPWVPIAGVAAADRHLALRLEVTSISPARKVQLTADRRAALAARRPAPFLRDDARFDDGGRITAITPRGLEAEFTKVEDEPPQWTAIQIARLLDPDSGQLRFENIEEPLLSALLTTQQFLVVSDPDAISRFFSPDAVRLAGWEFLLHPDTWDTHGTLLVVKNAQVPLRDLAYDTGAWTAREDFNADAAATSATLRTIIEDAERRIDEVRRRRALEDEPAQGMASDFEYFVDVVVRSPDWNGFLFLNANVGELPSDLAGLRAGIDESRFFAHHLGITQTVFKSLEDLRSRSTSMFGLILYEDRTPGFGGGSECAFRVEELDLLFRNSAVRDFRSTIALYVARLFGQTPTRRDAEEPEIRMEGVRQHRGDEDTYMFSTGEGSPLVFDLGTGPLREVTILQGEFETLSVDPDPEGTTRSRFSFAGFVKLADVSPPEHSGFDVFSFDELGFSNLAIDMAFANTMPRRPSFEFSLELSQLSAGQSTARNGSLFEGFPLKLGRFIGSSTDAPGGLGYMTVDLPLERTELPKPWYGVELLLDMGTLSDVAGAAGFEASLLMAWGPKPTDILLGLKLPGSGGANAELSLLGVIKLRIYSLSMRRSERAWALLLNGMTLKLLGKELPPSGSFDFYLFGNPDPTGSSKSLGWYGAYLREEEKQEDRDSRLGLPPVRALERLSAGRGTTGTITRDRLPPTIRRRGRRGATRPPGAKA